LCSVSTYAFHINFDRNKNTHFLRNNGLIIQTLPYTLVPLCRLFSSLIISSLWANWKSCLWVPASKMWIPTTPAKWVGTRMAKDHTWRHKSQQYTCADCTVDLLVLTLCNMLDEVTWPESGGRKLLRNPERIRCTMEQPWPDSCVPERVCWAGVPKSKWN
jgi:hypothetical protein